MRRELRRHPVQPKPARGSNRPIRSLRAAGTRGAGSPAARTRLRFLPPWLQPAWLQEVVKELQKVQWPTWLEIRNLTMVVIVVSAALGLFLGGLDAGFNWIFEN